MTLPPSLARLPARSAELRDLLIRWCDHNSGSQNAAGLEAMAALLADKFGRLPGASVERIPLAGGIAPAVRVTVRPSASKRIFLSGHFDTVYGADHPFQRCDPPDGDRLRGPGVTDMKGGLVVMLAAMDAFEQTPGAQALGYEILLGPDEEIGSPGSSPLLADAARRHRFGLIFEPARSNGDLVRSRRGIGRFTVTVAGRAAHAASPRREGRNAIDALVDVLSSARRLPAERPGILLNVGRISGGGPATNIVPDHAEAALDLRVASAADQDAIVATWKTLAAAINAREGFRMEISGGFTRQAKECVPAEERVFSAWQRAGRDLGLAPFDWVDSAAGSDANLLAAAGMPCLDGLGPIGDRIHSAEEWVHLPSLAERAQIAALFFHRLATGECSAP